MVILETLEPLGVHGWSSINPRRSPPPVVTDLYQNPKKKFRLKFWDPHLEPFWAIWRPMGALGRVFLALNYGPFFQWIFDMFFTCFWRFFQRFFSLFFIRFFHKYAFFCFFFMSSYRYLPIGTKVALFRKTLKIIDFYMILWALPG